MPFEPHVMEGAGQGGPWWIGKKTDRDWLWWVEAYHSQPPRKEHMEINAVWDLLCVQLASYTDVDDSLSPAC